MWLVDPALFLLLLSCPPRVPSLTHSAADMHDIFGTKKVLSGDWIIDAQSYEPGDKW
jgi:hypothetical protein